MDFFSHLGGYTIQEESTQIIRELGKLKDGQVVMTGPGSLPCENVMHAVGPRWKGGYAGEKDVLYDCVHKHILPMATENGFVTIAIPAISSGIFGFQPKDSTSIIVRAVQRFLDESGRSSSLREIYLIDNREEGAWAFEDALKTWFQLKSSPIASRFEGDRPLSIDNERGKFVIMQRMFHLN